MAPTDQSLMALTMALTQVARTYKAAVDRMAGDFELSQATALPVIMIGRMGDAVRPGMLAEALGLEPSSVVRLIDHLVEAGLVERTEDASDRRARTLHLTAEGRRRASQLEKALTTFRRKLFRGVDSADVQTCLAVLQSLDNAIGEYAANSASTARSQGPARQN